MVLLHGGASDSQDWVGTMAALSHRYSLYAPDLIGFGRSDRLKSGYYLSDFVQFTLEFIKKLGLDSPVLVGHSFGGRLCLQVAIRCPEMVRRLVLVDTAGFGKMSRWGGSLSALLWAMRKLFRRSQPYPKFLSEDGEEANWLCFERLSDLTAPTLIVWKRHDPYLPLASARRAEEMIPNARLAILPGYGHAPHKQNEDSFNRLLLDFLDHD
ncbi:alpha/beta fold hydrolase [Chloroflexota bacterium]